MSNFPRIDLQGGVVPISKAASSLAALGKRARRTNEPVVVTQKGYPSMIIISVELYNQLTGQVSAVPVEALPDIDAGEIDEIEG